MGKTFIIPKLAASGIRKNGIVYLPYIFTTAFSVAVFFIFSCIINNQMLKKVPYAEYVRMLLITGKYLLGMILIPFLFYTNSFLIKRRKKELGLYTVLGLEKKHVAGMLTLETAILYVISVFTGLLTGIVFAKAVFLIMLRVSGLPEDISFTMDAGSFHSIFVFFGIVSGLNLISNLWQVTRVNPTELLSSGKKGEKEPKHLLLFSLIGAVSLLGGYAICFMTKVDSLIFLKFPVAVILVVIGTYFLFTSGSIVILKKLKRNNRFYYRKENYVTVSGMLYRMKKSAASLVNICVFSTMVIITLLCTVALTLGEKDAIRYNNAFDARYNFWYGKSAENSAVAWFGSSVDTLAAANQVQLTRKEEVIYGSVDEYVEGTTFRRPSGNAYEEKMTVRLLTLDTYNHLQGTEETLKEGEAIIFSSFKDYGYDRLSINGKELSVKKEVAELTLENKEEESFAIQVYYVIVKDMETIIEIAEDNIYYGVYMNVEGTREDKLAFFAAADEQFHQTSGTVNCRNILDWESQIKSMDGGLLFIGVFFGLIFTICLVLIMYYKQISEGLEDSDSFHIMKKVGMSEEDVKATIHKQILMVFAFPLIVAIIHTVASINMTIHLLYALNLFNTVTILISAVIVIVCFTLFYIGSYAVTARTYLKIVY